MYRNILDYSHVFYYYFPYLKSFAPSTVCLSQCMSHRRHFSDTNLLYVVSHRQVWFSCGCLRFSLGLLALYPAFVFPLVFEVQVWRPYLEKKEVARCGDDLKRIAGFNWEI